MDRKRSASNIKAWLKDSSEEERETRKCKWDVEDLPVFEKNFYREHIAVQTRPTAEIERFRKAKEITTTGEDVPKPVYSFHEAGFPVYIQDEITRLAYQEPYPVQCQCWSIALSGRDMVGIAQTGSGKTLAYILPALVHINHQPMLQKGDGPIAVVLVPTRELALQVHTVARQFGRLTKISCCAIYGGSSRKDQIKGLEKGCEIIVATPGRLLDLTESHRTNLKRCTYLVLDEADRMLEMGFLPQINCILDQIRPNRQTLMFSATWPEEVRELSCKFLNNFIQVNIGKLSLQANQNILQIIDVCIPDEKAKKLEKLLQEILAEDNNMTLIFVDTKKRCDDLTRYLRDQGWPALCIHGDKTQPEREWVLSEFKSGRAPILIATDVASRGLDIPHITFVVNYDFPRSLEDYVHRIGRTARAAKRGTSYTFFTELDGPMASRLVDLLDSSKQRVNPKLEQLAVKYSPGFKRGQPSSTDKSGPVPSANMPASPPAPVADPPPTPPPALQHPDSQLYSPEDPTFDPEDYKSTACSMRSGGLMPQVPPPPPPGRPPMPGEILLVGMPKIVPMGPPATPSIVAPCSTTGTASSAGAAGVFVQNEARPPSSLPARLAPSGSLSSVTTLSQPQVYQLPQFSPPGGAVGGTLRPLSVPPPPPGPPPPPPGPPPLHLLRSALPPFPIGLTPDSSFPPPR